MCAFRAYVRHRAMLLEYRAVPIQHLQKALHPRNVPLTQVLTDITGVTGLASIRAIVAGERDPVHLARFRAPPCARSTEDIAKALTGHYQPEHVLALKQALALYDFYTRFSSFLFLTLHQGEGGSFVDRSSSRSRVCPILRR